MIYFVFYFGQTEFVLHCTNYTVQVVGSDWEAVTCSEFKKKTKTALTAGPFPTLMGLAWQVWHQTEINVTAPRVGERIENDKSCTPGHSPRRCAHRHPDPGMGPEEHEDCTSNRHNTVSSSSGSTPAPVQSQNGGSSPRLSSAPRVLPQSTRLLSSQPPWSQSPPLHQYQQSRVYSFNFRLAVSFIVYGFNNAKRHWPWPCTF